jgi:hypothetical protein
MVTAIALPAKANEMERLSGVRCNCFMQKPPRGCWPDSINPTVDFQIFTEGSVLDNSHEHSLVSFLKTAPQLTANKLL